MLLPLMIATSAFNVNSYWNSTVVKAEVAKKFSDSNMFTDRYTNIAWYESDLFGF